MDDASRTTISCNNTQNRTSTHHTSVPYVPFQKFEQLAFYEMGFFSRARVVEVVENVEFVGLFVGKMIYDL